MSAKAELGTLVRTATRLGLRGRERRRNGSMTPSDSSSERTASKRRITVLRLGRMSSTCTANVARAAQKFSFPTTVTPSPSWGL